MVFNDFLQRSPDVFVFTLHHLLRILNIVCQLLRNQFAHDKGFEKLQCHIFWHAALIELQIRTDDDNGTTGIVNAFAQKVLAETTGFALQQIGQALQRAIGCAGHCFAATAVINECIHSFLQHTLLVTHDNTRRTDVQESLQTIVAVDYAAIQVIQIRSGKAAALQLYHRTQIRRHHRQYG